MFGVFLIYCKIIIFKNIINEMNSILLAYFSVFLETKTKRGQMKEWRNVVYGIIVMSEKLFG